MHYFPVKHISCWCIYIVCWHQENSNSRLIFLAFLVLIWSKWFYCIRKKITILSHFIYSAYLLLNIENLIINHLNFIFAIKWKKICFIVSLLTYKMCCSPGLKVKLAGTLFKQKLKQEMKGLFMVHNTNSWHVDS